MVHISMSYQPFPTSRAHRDGAQTAHGRLDSRAGARTVPVLPPASCAAASEEEDQGWPWGDNPLERQGAIVLRKRLVAIPAVAAIAMTTATAVLLAPAAAAGTVPVVTTVCPNTLTVATFEPGAEVSGTATVTSRDAADQINQDEGLFLLEEGTSRPFTLAVHLGAQTDVSQTFSFTATGTSLSACLLHTVQGGGEENIGTVWTNVTT